MSSRTLTEVNQISLKEFEDYSQSYANIGHILMDLNIVHTLSQHIANMLPDNYTAVNLGSGDGSETKKILQACQKIGKRGTFINVDPFITREDVLKITSEQFITKCQEKSLDMVFCKCSFHFNKNQQLFFKEVYRCLKDSGKFVVLQMGNKVQLPWGAPLQSNYLKLLLLAYDFIPADLFEWKLQKESKKVKLEKRQFRQFVKNRSWSNLLTNSQEQIDQSLSLIDSQSDLLDANLQIWRFTIQKKKVSD